MFDAKSLLEQIVTGGGKAQQQGAGAPGLGDLLGQIIGGGPAQTGGGGGAASGGLGDILGKLGQAAGGQGGGLDSILNKIGAGSGGSGGNILDTLTKALTQATEGVKDGATRAGEATGATTAARDALDKAMGGKSPDQVLAQIKDMIANNQLGAGAVLGGLGGLLLGTRTGRSVATGAVKLGAIALISGLAYKAYQNYEAGKPLISGATAAAAAPQGSGFEPEAVTNEGATLIIRAMIAAAAADGRIDDGERQRVLATLGDAAANPEARAFIEKELRNPARPSDLAALVRTREEALQVYTAARIAIEPDSAGEKAFLADLASKLGIEPQLAAHIDATARNA